MKDKEKQIEFKVIDNNTGKEADIGKIALKEDWAKGLMYCDMQGFAILDDGNLVLLDECGKYEYCPSERFSIKFEDSVVLSKEEYDELINLQRTHAEDLTNAIRSYEESKADLKLEYDNHIKNLEKIIDRQSKDLNSQADRLIDLKAELENKGKETAEKFLNAIADLKIVDGKVCAYDLVNKLEELAKSLNIEIKE